MPRHYLAGEPVRAGAILELQMPDGSWQRASYVTLKGARAVLYVSMAAGQGIWVDVRPEDELRWPEMGAECDP